MIRPLAITVLAALGVVLSGGTARAELLLEFKEGRVTILAVNATTREILERWAAVGGTRIVGLTEVTGSPVTLELREAPERTALEILLRPFAGHMASTRSTPVAGQSIYEGVLILPASRAVAPAAALAAAPHPDAPMSFTEDAASSDASLSVLAAQNQEVARSASPAPVTSPLPGPLQPPGPAITGAPGTSPFAPSTPARGPAAPQPLGRDRPFTPTPAAAIPGGVAGPPPPGYPVPSAPPPPPPSPELGR